MTNSLLHIYLRELELGANEKEHVDNKIINICLDNKIMLLDYTVDPKTFQIHSIACKRFGNSKS